MPDPTEARLRTLLTAQFCLDDRDPMLADLTTATLASLNGDSLDPVELALEIEEEFGFALHDDHVEDYLYSDRPLSELVALIDRKLGEKAS